MSAQNKIHIIESVFASKKREYFRNYCTRDMGFNTLLFETGNSYDGSTEIRTVFELIISDYPDINKCEVYWAVSDSSMDDYLSAYPFIRKIQIGTDEYFDIYANTKNIISDCPSPCEELIRRRQFVVDIFSEKIKKKILYMYPDPIEDEVWHTRPEPYVEYLTENETGRKKIFNYIRKRLVIEPVIKIIVKKVSQVEDKIKVSGIALAKIHHSNEHDTSRFSIKIGENPYPLDIHWERGLSLVRGYRLNAFDFSIPVDDLLSSDIQNRVTLVYDDNYYGSINYNLLDRRKGHFRKSKSFTFDDKIIFLRQTNTNTTYFTVRPKNFLDTNEGMRLLSRAYVRSKLLSNKDIILLFEKECDKYEESASVLFEKLIDEGYDNVYFVLDRNNPKMKEIDSKYRKKILYKHSLEHLTYFFATKKFIGTETLPHAIQLRYTSKLIRRKLSSRNLQYVFLQHGVMYMISLSSGVRTGFKKQKDYKLHRVVVSSELEAKHFIDMAGYAERDLYVCGLPKFDTAYKYDDADKIIIMPTWRRWEVNEASTDYSETAYFKMILRIVDAIPKSLHDKITILPHPLMTEAFQSSPQFSDFVPKGNIEYDEMLRQCKLLITDYSSISFDAFYRGSNVIFYWEEKDECMTHYGQYARLMLDEDNAFGDICYNVSDLKNVVEHNYYEEQSDEYVSKYRQIVTYHDGKNTERLISYLKRDNII